MGKATKMLQTWKNGERKMLYEPNISRIIKRLNIFHKLSLTLCADSRPKNGNLKP